MVYYRNYSPEYNNSEEFTQEVLEKIKQSPHWYYYHKNLYPYNCKNTIQNIECDHWTLFYNHKTDKDWIRHEYNLMLRKWYTIQEVPMIEKSIKIPHIHFIKNTT